MFTYEMERFSAEFKFAERFTAMHKEQTAKWKPLLEQAQCVMEQLPVGVSIEAVSAAVRKAEKIMAPLGKAAKKYIIHCVGHAHIDMNWMWSYPETVAVVNDTFTTVLQLLDEYPDFIFSQSQAAVYEMMEKYNPALLERIRAKVKEKRWEITASHWVENDNNIAGGEALFRHLLYTRRYMKKIFALNPEDVQIDWCPDTFGHAATIPTYLVQGGVKYCYMHRPGNANYPLETFWWESPDGSRILVRNDSRYAYNGKIKPDLAEKMMNSLSRTGGKHYMFVYGVGDHGGGPTRRDLDRIVDMGSWPIYPSVQFSSAKMFFGALEAESGSIPVHKGELNTEFTGCYTSQSEIKRANRSGENRLADAEYFSTLFWKFQNAVYPTRRFEEQWRNCLFTHFHDILPGSGVRETREYTMGHFQDILTETHMAETMALRQMAAAIDTTSGLPHGTKASLPKFYMTDVVGAGAGLGAYYGDISTVARATGGIRPFVIFNPVEKERDEVVIVTIWDDPTSGVQDELRDKKFAVRTSDGKLHAAQVTEIGFIWHHNFAKVAIPVHVEALGYTTCSVIEVDELPDSSDSGLKTLRPMNRTATHAYANAFLLAERAVHFGGENKYIELEINPTTGGILRLRDKASGHELISPENQTPLLEYFVETAHGMSAWCVNHGGKKLEPQVKSIIQKTCGPWLFQITVELVVANSQFTVTYEMTANSPMVSIAVHSMWVELGNERDGIPALRMPFALNLKQPRLTCEIPFGALKREQNQDEEMVALQFVKASEGEGAEQCGVLLVNDCKYGYALCGNTLRASLIRSSFDPDRAPELGEHDVRFGIIPFSSELSTAEAARLGRAFNHALRVVGTDCHRGALPEAGSFLSISGDDVVVSGIKKAEDDDGIIIRLYGPSAHESKARIVFNRKFGSVSGVWLVDAGERTLEALSAKQFTTNAVEVAIPPCGIVSIKVTFK